MKRMMLAAALAALTVVPAKADPDAVKATISAQLEAFRAGNAERAYSFAAPSIRRMFGTPEQFIGMVQRGYRAVYEARDSVFLRSRALGDGRFAQEVALTDGDGVAWTALYTLDEQPDGTWKITGCYLRKAEGATI